MTDRKKIGGLSAPVELSEELAAIVGSGTLPRSQVVSRVWDYIKQNNLQDRTNRRMILPDTKLRQVVGKDRVSMSELDDFITKAIGGTHGSGGGRDD